MQRPPFQRSFIWVQGWEEEWRGSHGGGSCRIRPRANTEWAGKRREPCETHLEGHLSKFKIYFYILCELFNALMKLIIHMEDLWSWLFTWRTLVAKMSAPCLLPSQSPSSQKGVGEKARLCFFQGLSSAVVPGVSAHDLHIFQGFPGRELMFLFFLSFSLVWPQNSFPVSISAYVCAHVEVKRQLGVVLTQTPPTLVFQMGSLPGLGFSE